MSRKNKFLVGVSPLGLLALSACGGGSSSGGGGGSTPAASGSATSGKAQSGPLNNATVFLDYNFNGVWDAGETKTITDENGIYKFDGDVGYGALPTSNTYQIVVTTTQDAFNQSITTDSTIGGIVSNITLIAPSGVGNAFNGASVMVTPATTMVSNLMALDASLSATDAQTKVSTALGFTAADIANGFNPLTFDAFSAIPMSGAELATYDALALKAEKTSKKIMTVVNTLAAAAEGSGASQADAFSAAMGSVSQVLGARIDTNTTLDFDLSADIAVITTQLSSDIASISGASKSAFDDVSATIQSSIANVVKAIDDISDINDTQSTFQTIALVSAQVKTAVANAQINLADADLYAGQDVAAISVAAEVADNAALVITGTGTITNAVAQRVTITSAGDDSGISFVIGGTDVNGIDQLETVAGTNAGTATSANAYLIIYTITAVGDPAGTVSAGLLGTLSKVVADADGIFEAAAVANNAALTFDGVLADVGAGIVTNVAAVKVTITSTLDDTGIKFALVGTDKNGAALTETVTIAGTTATSTGEFLTISSITADGAPTGAISAGVLGNFVDTDIALSDVAAFATVNNSTAPTDISGTSSYSEADTSKAVGTLATNHVDVNGANVIGHTYTLLSGGDASYFTLTSAGVLSFGSTDSSTTPATLTAHQPDFETKSSYTIKVMTVAPTGKSYIETLQISIDDVNEAAVITAVGDIVTEDSLSYTVVGTVSAVDPEGQTVTYSTSSPNGAYGGTLEIDPTTGAYTYTMDNENGSVQDLQAADTLTETFTILASDGGAQGSGSLSFTIRGADDVYLTPPLASDPDGISVAAAVANNGALVIGGVLAASGSVTNASARKVTITSAGDDSADPDCISVAASVTGNTALVIGGAMASGGSVTHTAAEKVTITSVGDDSGITFTVVGTDAAGAVLTEVVTGANAAVATSSGSFLTVASITASASTAGDVTAGSPAITFTVVGTDAAGVALTETITGTNAGTATSTGAFLTVSSITAVGDPAGNVTAGALGHILTEGGSTTTVAGTLSGSDPADGTLNYSISGSIVADGSYSSTGTYGSLTINATTGAYVYTLDNTDADTNGIAKDAVLTETFKVRVDNGSDRSTKDLKIEITGINDDPVVTAPIGGTTTEGGTSLATGNLATADPDSGESATAIYGITGGTVTAGQSISTGTYGNLVLNVTSGAYTYTLDQADADTVALTAADSVSETFTVTTTDVNGASGSGTLSIAVVGTGITTSVIATDDKVNAFEAGDADGISVAAAVGDDAALVIGGDLASGGSVTLASAKKVTIKSVGDDSLITFTVVGTDAAGAALTETVTGANAGTATSTGAFKTIASVTAVGDPAGDVSVGTDGFAITGRGNVGGDVSLKFNSGAYKTATVDANGDWVVNLVEADITAMGQGGETVTATIGDANGVSVAASVVGNTALVIGGALAAGGSVTNGSAKNVTITSVGNDSGITFTVVGTNAAGAALTEVVTGANAGTASSTGSFLTVASITASGSTAGNVTAGTGSVSSAKSFAVDTVIPTTAITAVKYNITPDGDGISEAAAVGNNAALVLGGVLASSGAVTNSLAQKITITSAGNDSAKSFTIVGTDAAGAALTETLTGANAGTATSAGSFLTVASITAVGNPIGNVSVGTDAKQIVLTGTNFTGIGAAGTDVKSQIDWTKLVWDINGDSSGSVTFALGDIASAVVTSATVLTIQLTGVKAASFEGTSGFAAAGSADNVDIAVGFSVDGSGNVATTDAAGNVNPSYSDDVRPTVAKFSSTTADGSFKLGDTINITATLSEVVLGGSSITVTLNDTGNTTVLLTTANNGSTLSGTYTVPANATQGDLSINSYVVTSAVSDPYGNTLQSTALPTGQNLADNQAFVIDTSVPTNTISSVQYNSTDKTIILTGTGMTTIEVAGTDVKSVLDWTKLNWDLDGDDAATAGKTFVLSDITSAIVTSGTVFTVTLTAAAATALEATVGFAADGLGSTDTADTIDVLAGFSVDLAGNPATTDGAANLSPTYSDGTKPTVASFTSTTANGSYKEGDTINVTANMSEVVLGGGSITVTLTGTGDTVVLSTTTNSNTLTGTYTIPGSKTATDLSVSSFVVTSAVKDLYGNTLTDTSLPSSIAADADGISVAAAVANNAALVIGGALSSVDADGISVSAAVATNAVLVIGGALASSGAVTNAVAENVTITSTGNDSLISFTVVGTNASGAALTETVTGANAATATSTNAFLTISSITAVGNPVGNVSVGTIGSVSNTVAQKVTIASAGNDSAITFTVVGTDATGTAATETVTGANAGTSTSVGLFKTITSITAVGDPAGTVTAGTAVNAQNLADFKDINVDTTVPTTTLSAVSYGKNATTGAREIIFTGESLNTVAATDTDVRSSLDWSKLTWDLDGSSTNAGITFAAGDFTSAIVSSATTLTATLTDTKAASLEGTNGFAQDGLGDTAAADNVDIAAGFIVDLAGNVAANDALADFAVTYANTVAPTVTKFASSSPNGGYTTDDNINITATMSEAVIAGGVITVTLDTGESLDLTAAANGTSLTGTYTVGAGKTSADLAVNSFEVKTAVTSLFNKSLTDVTVPGSQNLSDNAAIVIDTAGPTNTITGIAYDSAAKTITLAGTSFSTIAAVNADVKTSVDWTKFVWDLDGDGVGNSANAGVTFSSGDITSAIITSATVMTITLTDAKAADLVAVSGFAADGLGNTNTDDNVDIAAGFSRDSSGNAATTDGAASLVPTYSDTVKPTITSFTSTTADGGYGDPKQDINITATASETVLAGSSVNVTLDTGDVVALTAATNGTTLVGTYDPSTGDTSSDLTVSSFAAGSAGVTDTYGNTLNVTSLPTGQNLGDSSAIFIDTAKPTSAITAVAYNSTGGILTLTGTNMTSLGSAGADVKANLDWTKLNWDLDANSSDAGVSFQLSDITSATVTNATTLTIDLTAAKQSSLEGTTGFGAGGLEAGTIVGDNVDIAVGFTRDAVGNASTDDAAANKSPTYADSTKPTVSSFTSTTTDGSYKSGDAINITATMSESILAGSKMTVTLSTTDLVTLTAGQNGSTLLGTYTISSTDVSSDLAVSSYSLTDAAGATNSVIDAFGNAMSSTTLPAGQNLSDNKALVVDNTALFANATVNISANPAAGDTFALGFNEAVGNTAILSGVVAGNAAFGTTAATSVWSNSDKTMTVTLGAGETLADMSLVFASVLDLAGNEATSVTYTLDIA